MLLLFACGGGGGGGSGGSGAGGGSVGGVEPTPPVETQRSVLFIAIDDLRVDGRAITPALDALAAQSTVYSNAYTTALWCLPARTSVMFGLSPATHRVGLANELPDYDAPPFTDIYDNPELQALPELFAAAGHTTGVAGKVFHEPQPSRWDVNGPPIPWSDFYDPLDDAGDGTYLHNAPLPEGEAHPDEAIAEWGVQFINNQSGPFFLAIGFFQPHLPWIAPQWAYDLYPDITAHEPVPGDLDDESELAREYAALPLWLGNRQYQLVEDADNAVELTRGYLAAISHTDAMVGRLLDALAASPHAASTDIVVWSDHGFHLGEKFHWRKRTYWQPTVQVPLIIRAASLAPGTVGDAVSLLDLGPTVLDLAGLPAAAQFEGVSLRVGRSAVEVYDRNGRALISNGSKEVDYDIDLPGDADRARYDLDEDPGELRNLVSLPP